MTWTPIIINGVLMTSHPEQLPGELFYRNCSCADPSDFDSIDYSFKRKGQDAYEDGKIVGCKVPVFIRESEEKLRHKEVTVEIGH